MLVWFCWVKIKQVQEKFLVHIHNFLFITPHINFWHSLRPTFMVNITDTIRLHLHVLRAQTSV